MNGLSALFEETALAAGIAVLDVYHAGANAVAKVDGSPVTEADLRAEAVIFDRLARASPSIPIVGEEAAAAGCAPSVEAGAFFLVDPLDGTKEFIARRDDFTVNIALIDNGKPIAGIVYAPALRRAYIAAEGVAQRLEIDHSGRVRERREIRTRGRNGSIIAVASRSHSCAQTETFLARHRVLDCTSVGSSLKFCLLAEGRADVYPRFGRTMEWDTAAGDAVLAAAGGTVLRLDGSILRYGKCRQESDCDFANPHFVAWAAAPPEGWC
ncbi:3'(2'),5'-bisphosphate nucleotidase CysQ [Ensifer sp.]|uniref:3'(2'),5'-bisphosphate nucleotidase CysQ n=1 Tax=Ensifer sp. TaxID=1872086 RepID=UPI0028A0176C|nr:3'(2'),5'-bisphosphate nucleotidase CysQ [Ensifer sp.]